LLLFHHARGEQDIGNLDPGSWCTSKPWLAETNRASAFALIETAWITSWRKRKGLAVRSAILSIAAVAESLGCETTVFDLNRRFFEFSDAVGEAGIDGFAESAAREIAKREADVYGFGSICSGYPLTLRIAGRVKAIHPEATVLLGGPQASVVAQPTLASFPFVDFVLRGESEASLPIFLEELSGEHNFDRVPGLTHRSIWGIRQNADAPPIADLDDLPMPAYHLTGELHGAEQASLELGRGCPFACTFCSTNDFFRRKFRLRSPERVLQDMRAIEGEYGIREFILTHDMFTVDAKRVRAFCHHMIASGTNYRWSCSARTDSVDRELLELMAEAGCTGVFFGVETGSERMQKIIDKHLDTNRAHQIIDIVRPSTTPSASLSGVATKRPRLRFVDQRDHHLPIITQD